MFYNETILTKTGALGKVWLAALWDKKLTKNQLLQTNIPVSCDAISGNEQPMALRTSGQLLLGVVKIYARKVRYLLEDCNDAIAKIKMAFRPGAVDLPEDQHVAALHAITMPETMTEFDILMPEPAMSLANRLTQMAQPAAPVGRKDDITMDPHLDASFALLPATNLPRQSEHDALGYLGQDDGGDMGFDFDFMPETGRNQDSMEIEVGRREAGEVQAVGPTSPLLPGAKDASLMDDSLLAAPVQPDARDFSFRAGEGDQSMQPDFDFGDANDLFGPDLGDAAFQFDPQGGATPVGELEKTKKKRRAAPGKKNPNLIRKRKMIYDEHTEISSKEILAQLKDTSDINMLHFDPFYLPYYSRNALVNSVRQNADDFVAALVQGLPEEIVMTLHLDRPFKKQRHHATIVPDQDGFEAFDDFDAFEPEQENRSIKSPQRKKSTRTPFSPIDINAGQDFGFDDFGFDDGMVPAGSPLREESVVPEVPEETGPFTNLAAGSIKLLQNTFPKDVSSVEFHSLTDKNKREEAVRLFFDVLVLKTHDVIDVEQATPYGTINIMSKERLFEIA